MVGIVKNINIHGGLVGGEWRQETRTRRAGRSDTPHATWSLIIILLHSSIYTI